MFYIIEITKGELDATSETINRFSSLREAQSHFYMQYGTALGSEDYKSELIMLMDDKGTIYNVEHFENQSENESDALMNEEF